MRKCPLPLVVALECRLAAHVHLDPVRVRRAPLPLVLLWANHAAQVDGQETWWMDEQATRKDAAGVRQDLAAARAQAAQVGEGW